MTSEPWRTVGCARCPFCGRPVDDYNAPGPYTCVGCEGAFTIDVEELRHIEIYVSTPVPPQPDSGDGDA